MILFLSLFLAAQDLKLPAEVQGTPGAFITILAETTGKRVKFVCLDPGLSVFPAELLANPKATVVSGVTPGRYRVLGYTAAGDLPSEPAICSVVIGQPPGPVPPPPSPGPGPNPVPTPPPPVPPGPGPDPSPIPADGLRVLMLYDSATLAKMPAAQQSVLYSPEVRGYLNAKCTKTEKGNPEWRVWPASVDASAEGDHWQKALKRERKSLPWLLIGNGKTGYEGPLPGTVEDMMKLLKTYGGE